MKNGPLDDEDLAGLGLISTIDKGGPAELPNTVYSNSQHQCEACCWSVKESKRIYHLGQPKQKGILGTSDPLAQKREMVIWCISD